MKRKTKKKTITKKKAVKRKPATKRKVTPKKAPEKISHELQFTSKIIAEVATHAWFEGYEAGKCEFSKSQKTDCEIAHVTGARCPEIASPVAEAADEWKD